MANAERAPIKLLNLLACQSILSPRSLSPWKPMIPKSLLNAGGTIEIRSRRIPKQKLAPEWMKTSIWFLKMSESGSWLSISEGLGDDASESVERDRSESSFLRPVTSTGDAGIDLEPAPCPEARVRLSVEVLFPELRACMMNFCSILRIASRAM